MYMIPPLSAAALLLTASLALGSAGLFAQTQPTFEVRDATKLRCRVVSAKKSPSNYTVLEVQVTNHSDRHAEPLQFAVKGPRRRKKGGQAESRFDRARMPLVGRFGQGIAPGNSRRYRVQTVLPSSQRLKVRVAVANFYRSLPETKGSEEPVVENLATGRGKNPFTGATFDIASFTIRNPLPFAADIWLLADCVRPVKDSVLVAYRVSAGGIRHIKLGVQPYVSGFDDSDTAFGANVEIRSIKVVDWIQIARLDHTSAAEAFASSYAKWHRWPDQVGSIRAKFKSVEMAKGRPQKKDLKLKLQGSITVTPNRSLTTRLEPKSSQRLRAVTQSGDGFSWASAGFLQRQAVRFLRRRSPSEFAEANQVKWITSDSVQVFGPSIDPDSANSATAAASDGYSSFAPRYQLDGNGHIVREGRGFDEANDWLWRTEGLGKGWVVSERHMNAAHLTHQQTETWKYAMRRGQVVLSEYRYVVRNGTEIETSQTLKFSEWEFDASAAALAGTLQPGPAPRGKGVSALRRAWARLYQFPTKRTRWAAKVAIQNNGTDLSWQGYDKFEGKFKRTGFGNDTTGLEFSLKDSASASIEENLGSVFFDRLGMWHGSDPQDMGEFSQAFAGAEILPRNAKGWHQLKNHVVERIRVRDGLVREFILKNGIHRRFHYENFEGVQLITRIERDVRRKTEVLIRPTRLGTWIVPTRYEFRRIFGNDWGPEIFLLSDLRILGPNEK